MALQGKKLLVLGGGAASYDLVKMARGMGVYTIVTDNAPVPGVAKQIADEMAMISTADIDELVAFVKEKKIDGVFTGPSEFNLRNVIRVCEKAGLPCYADMQTWNNCANKDVFKQFCRDYGVTCIPEYKISEHSTDEELQAVEYPIIVKPVDSCSSAGITTCRAWTEVRQACQYARSNSIRGEIVVEKYIENDCRICTARYVVKDGKFTLCFVVDDYCVTQAGTPFNVSNSSPSIYTKYYLDHVDAPMRKMLYAMGIRNGVTSIQTLPYKGELYSMEMCFRMAGGMMFKVMEPLNGVNDMKMMIRYALGEEIFTDADIAKIRLLDNPRFCGQVATIIDPGKIARIEGVEECKKLPCVTDILYSYHVGDTVPEKARNTLGQQLLRHTIIAGSREEYVETVKKIQSLVRVYNEEGQPMHTMAFDLERMNWQI